MVAQGGDVGYVDQPERLPRARLVETVSAPRSGYLSEINARLVKIMKEAFAGVWQVAEEKRVTLRTATFIVACQRILRARDLRGLYP